MAAASLRLCPCLNPSPDPATRDPTPRRPQARLSHLFRHHARELTLLASRFPDLDENLHNLRYLRTLLNLVWPTAAPNTEFDRSGCMPELGLPFRRYRATADDGQVVDTSDVYLAPDLVARGQGHMGHSADAAATVHAIAMVIKMYQEEWLPEGVRRNIEALGLNIVDVPEVTEGKEKKTTLDQLMSMDDLKRHYLTERHALQSLDLDPFKTSPAIALAALGVQYPSLSFAFDLARRQWITTASTASVTCRAIGFSVHLARTTALTQLVLLAASGMQPSIWAHVERGERRVNKVTFLLETFTPPLSLCVVPCTWAGNIVHAPTNGNVVKDVRDSSEPRSMHGRRDEIDRERHTRRGSLSRYGTRSRSRSRTRYGDRRTRSRSRSRSKRRSAQNQTRRDRCHDLLQVDTKTSVQSTTKDMELRNKLSLGLGGGSANIRNDSHQSISDMLYNANGKVMQQKSEQVNSTIVGNTMSEGVTRLVGHLGMQQGMATRAVGGLSAVTTTAMTTMMNGQIQLCQQQLQQQMPQSLVQSIGMGNGIIGAQPGVSNNMSNSSVLQELQSALAHMQASGAQIQYPSTQEMPSPISQPMPNPAKSALSQMTSALQSIDPSDRASLALHPLFALWLANPTAAALAHMHTVAPNSATGTGTPTSIHTAHVTQPNAQGPAWCAIASVPVTEKARAHGFGLGIVSAIRWGREDAVRACAAKVMLMV
ncbi:hypothetical protein BCR44DRAFT_1438600 [Catenaria anguillulae PL171]|uniref:Uncharacterized protein n=1 Tax=Catenaria anguillulae PL171 TaxID=765915 RepID=A0A1Y2HGW4_9FUNG|nr:hypothetical protein BCR44DRAFT_1438600 [Catenaria anguillulae PL171]